MSSGRSRRDDRKRGSGGGGGRNRYMYALLFPVELIIYQTEIMTNITIRNQKKESNETIW